MALLRATAAEEITPSEFADMREHPLASLSSRPEVPERLSRHEPRFELVADHPAWTVNTLSEWITPRTRAHAIDGVTLVR
jgi:hypothetical protein